MEEKFSWLLFSWRQAHAVHHHPNVGQQRLGRMISDPIHICCCVIVRPDRTPRIGGQLSKEKGAGNLFRVYRSIRNRNYSTFALRWNYSKKSRCLFIFLLWLNHCSILFSLFRMDMSESELGLKCVFTHSKIRFNLPILDTVIKIAQKEGKC